jgi:hypothetical protein
MIAKSHVPYSSQWVPDMKMSLGRSVFVPLLELLLDLISWTGMRI